jgi:hypothetical protein
MIILMITIMNKGRNYHIVIYDESGNYTRTTEYSTLNDNEFAQSKMEEGYIYNRIIGFILLLTKYNINVKIQDILTLDESDSEVWEYEKNTYGEYWNTSKHFNLL